MTMTHDELKDLEAGIDNLHERIASWESWQPTSLLASYRASLAQHLDALEGGPPPTIRFQ